MHSGYTDSAIGDDERAGEGSLALSTLKRRKKEDQSLAVKMLLMYRKNLQLLVEESVCFLLVWDFERLYLGIGLSTTAQNNTFLLDCCCSSTYYARAQTLLRLRL